MKLVLSSLLLLISLLSAHAQVWEVLPKGVRIFGYRNIVTSKVDSNFNKFSSEAPLGARVRVDAPALDQMPVFDGSLKEILPDNAYRDLVVGEYAVDASARFNVQGMGVGYGITDRIMFYMEMAYYDAHVDAQIKRIKGNTYQQVADYLEKEGSTPLEATLAANLRSMMDADEKTVQSFITNHYGYAPIGDWEGTGYGDMETGFMVKVLDRDYWGIMLYPGVVLPTGREDDPDILQDVGFGDGQVDVFSELTAGYSFNDSLSLGNSLRYTYQAPTHKDLRIPEDRDFPLSAKKGNFEVKYGDKINWNFNATWAFNDWLSLTPIYRFMYQMPAQYDSVYGVANDYLSYNSDKKEHQVQLTTTISSIQPYLQKKFLLPGQINFNWVQTVDGKNVPKVTRYELELRMLF